MSMKPTSDRFSENSAEYKKFRPTYPAEFLEEIAQLAKNQDSCWDCGTGNGQVAVELAKYFEKVLGTDISENQLKQAVKRENIQYSVARAEKTEFHPDQFDLITVAQAIHWFDFERFYEEVRRVSKRHGVLAVWGYGLLRFNNLIDHYVDHFYQHVIGPYWDKEREHIDTAYGDISFPFEEIELSRRYSIRKDFSLEEFAGYLSTWSAVKRYIKSQGLDPVPVFIAEIRADWIQLGENLSVEFPLFTKIGRIK